MKNFRESLTRIISTLLIAISTVALISGCSVSSDEVIAESVGSYQYNKMTCSELEGEMDHLQNAAAAAAGVVDERYKTQTGKDVAAVLLFWPALFIIDDNKPEARRLARLKGEFEAAENTYRRRKC